MIAQSLSVPFDYEVYFTERAFALGNDTLLSALTRREPCRRQRFVVTLDQEVARSSPQLVDDIAAYAEHHAHRLELGAPPVLIAGGEDAKNHPEHVARVWRLLDRYGIDRQSFVVAIGGGAMLDAVGYAAATAHRGVRLVRLPTTVLAQGDAGVGVKNGINAFGKKNFVGTFAPPAAVINDASFLTTLSRRDVIAGMAEAVKVALIRDPAFFDWIADERQRLARCDLTRVTQLVKRSAELHLAHIREGGDPFEMGSARPLDFGHWAAHKLESISGYDLRHGEAVAIGIALDTIYSHLAGLCRHEVVSQASSLLAALGFELWHEGLEARDEIGRRRVLAGINEFREHLGGELCVTLLEEVGRGVEVRAMREDLVLAAIEELRGLQGSRLVCTAS